MAAKSMSADSAALVIENALTYLEHLEALFDALRAQLDERTYSHALADLGQSTASWYVGQIAHFAQAEVRHG
ncbi:hypothetical protein PTE31013_02167 [Pandoraea terrigena]|uniref:Uncharacterized protein n=1 Tax=Pandoraea terrigena TaxID=2508292 RepID=A0A5E4URI5_9BURK|nr:hypothetical protein PTE31013_02167 [Pandoraea terrigena]